MIKFFYINSRKVKTMKKLLSASIMCADLLNLEGAINDLKAAGIDYLHIDIMDGAFVPNITLGFDLINAIKKVTDMPLDIHMMVNEPGRFIEQMNLDENDIVCVHYEADIHIHRTLELIKSKGYKAGLAINPQTPVESVKNLTVSPGFAGQKIFKGAEKKVTEARELLEKWGYGDTLIEVDGNISLENGRKMSRCGADIYVLGTSSLFLKDKSLEEAAKAFKEYLE